jgi:hypothetical protein
MTPEGLRILFIGMRAWPASRSTASAEWRFAGMTLNFILAGLSAWLAARLLGRGDSLGYLSLAMAIGFLLVALLGYRRRG